MKREILIFPNPTLNEKSSPVMTDKIDGCAGYNLEQARALAQDLIDTVRSTPGGVGLAAVQIGVKVRMIVIDVDREKDPLVLINPVVRELLGDKQQMIEGCLSFPGVFERVERHTGCIVDAFDLDGKPVVIDTTSQEIADRYAGNGSTITMLAHALQHEIEHLDGVLFIEHLSFTARERAKRTLHAHATSNTNLHRGEPVVRTGPKVGRNDPCPCGSGKKLKKCHVDADAGKAAMASEAA